MIELPVGLPQDRADWAAPARILIVDDTEPLREYLAEIVKAPNRQVVTASNESEAIRLASEAPFDVVITDINLTEAGGTETGGLKVLQAVRERDRTAAVIVVTAYGKMEISADDPSGPTTVSVEEKAKRSGCFAFIPRPHPTRDYLEVVREAVAEALEKRRCQDKASSTAR